MKFYTNPWPKKWGTTIDINNGTITDAIRLITEIIIAGFFFQIFMSSFNNPPKGLGSKLIVELDNV
jgi:hypothetical protein